MLQGLQAPYVDIANLMILAFHRGIPQPLKANPAYGVLVLWGMTAATTIYQDLLRLSRQQLRGWVSSMTEDLV